MIRRIGKDDGMSERNGGQREDMKKQIGRNLFHACFARSAKPKKTGGL